MLTHLARKPHTGVYHGRQHDPDNVHWFLHADLVGLALPRVTRLFDQRLLHGLAMEIIVLQPTRHRPLVEAARDDDGLQRTAMGHQGHNEGDAVSQGAQVIERSPCVAVQILRYCVEQNCGSLRA